jgi:hypothetical protein
MSRIIKPASNSLNPRAFDALVSGIIQSGGPGLILDLREIRFVEPFGVISLLFWLRQAAAGHRVTCWLPRSPEVSAYLQAINFYAFAGTYALLLPPPRSIQLPPVTLSEDFALEVTPVRVEEDVETVVSQLIERVQTILTHNLSYDSQLLNKICVALAEICQNIPQHSEDWGLVTLQSYRNKSPGGERFVKLAVGDLGIGIRNSLLPRYGPGQLDDGAAIIAALRLGVSRLEETGRGLGLATVSAFARASRGTLQVRSGRARVLVRGDHTYTFTVPDFPGTQIALELPALRLFNVPLVP